MRQLPTWLITYCIAATPAHDMTICCSVGHIDLAD